MPFKVIKSVERMKRSFIIFCLFAAGVCYGQEYKLQNYKPASPTAFEFLKYTDMPVSEYSGLPSISLPIYNIQIDGVSVPINLSYHAAGIRVSQEASWVGLGWDLQTGSIIQEVNDRDDLAATTIRKRPDWLESPIPTPFYRKYAEVTPSLVLDPGWNTIDPVYPPRNFFSYKIFTNWPGVGTTNGGGYYLPINGNRDNQPVATDMVNNPEYDSEPDIFSVSFFGHSFKFLHDFENSNQIHVLNKQGYKVVRTSDVYTITVPSGDKYLFEKVNTVESRSDVYSPYSNTTSDWEISSKIWMLTKIVTKNGKEITFNYSETGVVENLTSRSEKWNHILSSQADFIAGAGDDDEIEGIPEFAPGLTSVVMSSREKRVILKSIVFPLGVVEFESSSRIDLAGGVKLDAIHINSLEERIRSYTFTYSYFGDPSQPLLGQRLKLLSFQESSGATHAFSYDETPLPWKSSFAQDFWGFYNGAHSNTSLIPNPARLNATVLETSVNLGDNGNNNSARLEFAKAGILLSIQYPSKGQIFFDYGLNQFDNYWVPDYNSTANQLSTGNGLRVESIRYYAQNNKLSKKTVYEYSNGKALTPIKLARHYSTNKLTFHTTNYLPDVTRENYQLIELNAKGFFSPNSLGSGSVVGYGKVTKKEVDEVGNDLGRIEILYFNNPDDISSSANTFSHINAALPAKKHESPIESFHENGSEKEVNYYNSGGQLVKKAEYSYSVQMSEIEYGAKFLGYSNYYYSASNGSIHYWVTLPRQIVGYYPIFDLISYRVSTKTTEFDENGGSMQVTSTDAYDSYGQLMQTSRTAFGKESELISYKFPAYLNATDPAELLLKTSHRFSTLMGVTTQDRYDYSSRVTYQYLKEYKIVNSLPVESKVKIWETGLGTPKEIVFDEYDNYGNPIQITSNNSTTSFIRNYSGECVVAEVVNAMVSEVAYSSFETGEKGGWNYSNGPLQNLTAPTGKRVYQLSIGNSISRGGLDATRAYVISYWSTNGSYGIAGAGTPRQGITVNGWTYFEHKASGVTDITIAGSGQIDELRLYPEKAKMVTYSYKPLIGVSSQCDVNNRITYYEYDGSGRLILVRTQERNILKKICYNYAGQPEDCAHSTAPQWQNTPTPLRCQVDASNQNTGYQEQEQMDMNSLSTSYNQTRWVTVGPNMATCPYVCNSTNCGGIDKKCINGVCETGTIVFIGSSYRNGQWRCTYVYRWSDCSESDWYSMTGSLPCDISPECN